MGYPFTIRSVSRTRSNYFGLMFKVFIIDLIAIDLGSLCALSLIVQGGELGWHARYTNNNTYPIFALLNATLTALSYFRTWRRCEIFEVQHPTFLSSSAKPNWIDFRVHDIDGISDGNSGVLLELAPTGYS
jgi:hypothetical protein